MRRYSVKETYNFKEPTNRSHPISASLFLNSFHFRVWHINIIYHVYMHYSKGLYLICTHDMYDMSHMYTWHVYTECIHRVFKECIHRVFNNISRIYTLLQRAVSHMYTWHDMFTQSVYTACLKSSIQREYTQMTCLHRGFTQSVYTKGLHKSRVYRESILRWHV